VTETPVHLAEADLPGIFGLPDEQSWQERALCAQTDPEAFFPEKGGSIWGGLSERERRRVKRRAV
jgi:WhiB family redox-sensing transcriptional regulator